MNWKTKNDIPQKFATIAIIIEGTIYFCSWDDCTWGEECRKKHEGSIGISMGFDCDKVAYTDGPSWGCIDLKEVDGWIYISDILKDFKEQEGK